MNPSPHQLERYSFLWSETRLVIAAVALFIGGTPPVLAFNPIPAFSGILRALLTIAWIISGLASAYLLYRWNANGKHLFGGKKRNDMIAFLIMVASGFNLGIAGLININIGMSLASGPLVFILTGLVYLISAYYLCDRWNNSGKKLF